MWGAQTPSERGRHFFLEFIRRLLEHTSLLNLAYRMNKNRWRGEDNSGEWGREGDSGVFSDDAHVAAVL